MEADKRIDRLEKVLIELLGLASSKYVPEVHVDAYARLIYRLKDEPPVDNEHLQFRDWFARRFSCCSVLGFDHEASKDAWHAGRGDCAKQLAGIRHLLDSIGPNSLIGNYAAISKWRADYDKGGDDG